MINKSAADVSSCNMVQPAQPLASGMIGAVWEWSRLAMHDKAPDCATNLSIPALYGLPPLCAQPGCTANMVLADVQAPEDDDPSFNHKWLSYEPQPNGKDPWFIRHKASLSIWLIT